MQLTVATDDDKIVPIDVDAGETLENVKAILEVEIGVPTDQQVLIHNGNELNGATLAACGVQDGDLFMVARRPVPSQQGAATSAPGAGAAAGGGPSAATQRALALNPQDGSAVDPEAFINVFTSDPYQLGNLQARNPMLGEVIRARDVPRLQSYLRQAHAAKLEAERAERELYSGDPLDPAVQARIQEYINQKNIQESHELAMEHTPEAFAQVFMLYVDAEVNGRHLKTFVDSGAQMSIMTQACAESCGIMRLCDRRYAGMAKGVGSSKIIGRIHQVALKVQGKYMDLAISVLEQKGGPQFILGLDMLKRHQCCIDLGKNELRFGSTGAGLPFLAEHMLPKDFEDMMATKEEGGAAGQQQAGVSGEGSAATAMDEDAAIQKALEESIGGPIHKPAVGATGVSAAAGADGAAAGTESAPTVAAAPPAAAAATAPAPAAAVAPPAAAAAPVPAAAASGASEQQQDEKVQRLMALGFPRQQAVNALEMCGGNEELAASMMFGGF